MVREFSEEKKEEIFRILDEIDMKEWKPFMEWCGSSAEEFGDWPERLNVSAYTRYVDEYHKKVLELNEMTRQQVNTVFENVAEINTRYAGRMKECQVKIKEQIAKVNTMTEFMQSMTDVIPNKAHRSGGGSHANCDGTENNDESRQSEGVMGRDTGLVTAGFATIEREIDEAFRANSDEKKVGEEILLKYLIEQGIVIPEQQNGVLSLIWTERSDILGTLFIIDCKGEEKDEVLESAMEYCYGAAEKVFIEYMSKNGIVDPAAHMIVLDKIKYTNPQLLLNLIAENCDIDKEAEGLLEYYYSFQEGMTFSLERYDELRGLELADYHLNGTSEDPGGVGVYNDEGELIGIKPYYVMVNAEGGGFKDDGGITFGIGHNISAIEWDDKSDREHQLLSEYIPEDTNFTGITMDDLPGCRLKIVCDEYVPIDEVNRIFYEDIQEFSNYVANKLISEGIDVNQDEFDALVIYAYNKGSLPQKMLDYLKDGNREPEIWRSLWSGGDNRKEYCQDLFFPITN